MDKAGKGEAPAEEAGGRLDAASVGTVKRKRAGYERLHPRDRTSKEGNGPD